MSPIKPILATLTAFTLLIALSLPCHADFTIDFEDVGTSLGAESFYNGSDGAGGFSSGALNFNNNFGSSGGFDFWDGWSYSNVTDNSTAGFGNQFSAIFGLGDSGSSTYGVAFSDSATVAANAGLRIENFSITNTTYAALSMRDGDAFAKQFGGDSGNDPDFLKIDIDGFDEAGTQTGTLEFFLADYRFADNGLDYIVDQWTTVDVSSLDANRLGFRFSGSDVGQFGLNTPTYFAADNFTVVVPEPHLFGIYSVSACLFFARRNRK